MTNFQKISSTLILLFISSTVLADETKPYIGLGFGNTSYNIKSTSGASKTYTSSAFNLLGGLKLSTNLAVEAEYVNFGKFTDIGISAEAAGMGVSAVGIAPLSNNFSIFGKLGFSSVSSTLTAAPGYVLLVPATDSKAGISFGFGGEFVLAKNASIRASLNSYEYSAGGGLLTGRIGTMMVAGIFNF